MDPQRGIPEDFWFRLAHTRGKKSRIAAIVLLGIILPASLFFSPSTTVGSLASRSGAIPSGTTNPTTVSYQGYVTMGNLPYDATGYFKFAIVNAAGTTTYWSNDGTSNGGGEPIASVPLVVSNGYFTVLLGDTSLPGMTQILGSSVFSGPGRYLRLWFASAQGGPYTQLGLVPFAAAPYALNAETLDGVDSDALQRRVTGSCTSGNAIRVVNTDGTVTCQAVSVPGHNHWGESWSGSGTGLSLSANSTDIVLHLSNSGAGAALVAENSTLGPAGTFTSYGDAVIGTSTDLDGVRGISNGGGIADNGVYGETNSDDWGEAGVYGYSTSSAAGVIGASENGNGIWGQTYEQSNRGVAGVAGFTQNFGDGVRGESWGGYGVHAIGWNGDAAYVEDKYGGPALRVGSGWGYGAYITNTLYVQGDLVVTGSKYGYVVDMVRNADDTALEPGDIVAVVGVSDAILGEIPVMDVRRATSDAPTAVVGVVDKLYVYNGRPEIVIPACLEAQEKARQMAAQPTPTPPPLAEPLSHPLSQAGPQYPPPPDRCTMTEGFVVVDSIAPGYYLSVVTLGTYRAVKVDASYGAIQPGDLLVASPNPGYAMKGVDPKPGTILGKALAPWASGTGSIPVLVTLH